MANLFITVGIPGSGKSTWTKNHLRTAVYVSTDAIRKEINEDETSQKNANVVFDIFHDRIKKALRDGKDVIADATNISRRSRKNLLNLVHNGIKAYALWFDVPVNIALKRNACRKRHVPESVIFRMQNNLIKNTPAEEEGFAGVLRIDEQGCVSTIDKDYIIEKIWRSLEDVPFDEDKEGCMLLAAPFEHFPVGTDVEYIWHWFDEQHSKGVVWLMYELDHN